MVSLEKHLPHASSPARQECWLASVKDPIQSAQALQTKQAMVKRAAVPTSQTTVCDSAGYNMADLTREIINISFTLTRPFLPQLLLPGSQPFILLEKQILQLVRCPFPCFWDWGAFLASLALSGF